MKTNTYKVLPKLLFLAIFLGIFSAGAQGDPNNCIEFTNCPQSDIEICADQYNPDDPSEWGALLQTWTIPQASETCSGGPGSNSFIMDFKLNESLLGVDCWDFNYVQRVGTDGGYVRLFSSSGGPISYIITPYLYLEVGEPVEIDVDYTDGNYNMKVYYIDDMGNEVFSGTTVDIDATNTGPGYETYAVDPNLPSDGSYRIKYEFTYTGSKPSNTNIVDKISIDGVVVEGSCTGGVDFTVTGPEPPEFLPVGTHDLCYTATYTDPNGAIYDETCCITVHVLDTPPVITCPTPITQGSDPGLCTATVSIPSPNATDEDCAGTNLTTNLTVTAARSDGLDITDPYPLGVTTITHSATDDNGVTVTCEQTVTITGGANPSFDSQPAPISNINCNDSLPVQETLTASDCNGPVTVVPSVDDYTVDVCNGYFITYRWTAGVTEETQTFQVLPDITPPSIDTQASNETVECDGSGNPISLNAWLDNKGGAVASDLCGSVTWSNDFIGLSNDCGATGSATVTFTAEDDCGNEATTTATFSIVDNQNPSITPPTNVTVECGNSTEPADTGIATGQDNCGDVTITYTDNETANCGNTKTIERTWKATDECGHFTNAIQTITVEDTTPPVLTLPSDVTIECTE
ncbi:HYR domain-containing protein, partial [Flavisericum labens]|uniref:HYR domain-containing protein n=1 Tax=Flavisericum labens TaxID=3377112 RepID=UPI00387B0BE1